MGFIILCFERLKDYFANVQNLLDVSILKSRTEDQGPPTTSSSGRRTSVPDFVWCDRLKPIVLTAVLLCSELSGFCGTAYPLTLSLSLSESHPACATTP